MRKIKNEEQEIFTVESEIQINEDTILEVGDKFQIVKEDTDSNLQKAADIVNQGYSFFDLKAPLANYFGRKNVDYFDYRFIQIKTKEGEITIAALGNVELDGSEIISQDGKFVIGY